MTQQNLVIDADKGLVALYSGPVSDDVEDNPLSHLDKTTFNSKLDNIGFTRVQKTYTLPARAGLNFVTDRINLGAHGKTFTPICFAVLRGWLNGDGNPVDLDLAGGVLLDFYGQRPDDTGVFFYEGNTNNPDRWQRTGNPSRTTFFDDSWQQKSLVVGAGADGANLFLWYEQAVWPQGGDGASYPAFPLTIDFYIGDRSIDGVTGDAPPSALFLDDETGVKISSTRLTASGTTEGGFDSDNGYFHADAVDPMVSVVTSDAAEFSSGGAFPNLYKKDALYFAPHWQFDMRTITGAPTVPATVAPTVQGVSL